MQKPDAWFDVAHLALRPGMAFWFNWRFEGMEHIPREGPVLIAGNHISYFDPLAHAYMLVKAGRHARFLAKKELYGNRLLRRALVGAGQIPVDRGSGSMAPVNAAVNALQGGEAVVVYPEGTVTKDPGHLPMQGRTGIARLTLGSDVPVLPIAVWGSQHVWQRNGSRSLRFGRPIWLKAGAPRDFSEFAERRDEPEALRAVTDAIMADLTQLVTDLRSRYPKDWAS